MGFFKKSSKCEDCGLTDGKHARNCEQAGGKNFTKRNAAWGAEQRRAQAGQRRAAKEFVEKYKDTRFTKYTPAGPGNQKLPPGTKMERTMYKDPRTGQWEKGYKIILSDDDD